MDQLLKELKEYLRIDGDEENSSLNLFIHSAILTLDKAGVKQPRDPFEKTDGVDTHALYRLAVYMLSTHYYENRTVITPTTIRVAQIPVLYGLEMIILQLKAEALPSESESV